jgi:preprotein translocase subunit SecA
VFDLPRRGHAAVRDAAEPEGVDGWLARGLVAAAGLVVRPAFRRPWLWQPSLRALAVAERRLGGLTAAGFAEELAALRHRLAGPEALRGCVIDVLALIREAAKRELGQRHYDVQMLGGMAMLRGCIAEMQTGEGKTLAATLPAAAAALAGVPVHVLTANDYLAQRDAQAMQPLYAALGLSVGCLRHGQTREERRRQYACHVVYAAHKEVAFDWLRDVVALDGRLDPLGLHAARLGATRRDECRVVDRGLHMAIVDEADGVLLDDACTPLIISRSVESAWLGDDLARQALALAETLGEDADYRLDRATRRAELTSAGVAAAARLGAGRGGLWSARPVQREVVEQAVAALRLFRRDTHYLVRDGEVQIIDEASGRTSPDRRWERGLHHLIEIKEGCRPRGAQEAVASMTYQRFFRLYRHLAGMTGTASPAAAELWNTYRLPVVQVPPNRPRRFEAGGIMMVTSMDQKWHAIADRIAAVRARGRPVLVGTRTVGQSEALSAVLTERGVPHDVLNARQDAEEARIIAQAGQVGRVTIATNMAGRGTDILLGPGVSAAGGLHVIATELHDSPRIDRQLVGRCARQGDPGSAELILSLDDGLLHEHMPRVGRLLRALPDVALRTGLALAAMRLGQWRITRRRARERRLMLRAEANNEDWLALAGRWS